LKSSKIESGEAGKDMFLPSSRGIFLIQSEATFSTLGPSSAQWLLCIATPIFLSTR
jgi:hypothetical protein